MDNERVQRIGERVYAADVVEAQQEQLRELLSYCKVEAEKFDPDEQHDEFNPYDDVAYRLGQILDGEQ